MKREIKDYINIKLDEKLEKLKKEISKEIEDKVLEIAEKEINEYLDEEFKSEYESYFNNKISGIDDKINKAFTKMKNDLIDKTVEQSTQILSSQMSNILKEYQPEIEDKLLVEMARKAINMEHNDTNVNIINKTADAQGYRNWRED